MRWQEWRVIDLFGGEELAGVGVGFDRVIVAVLDDLGSNLETGDIASDIWVGTPRNE